MTYYDEIEKEGYMSQGLSEEMAEELILHRKELNRFREEQGIE